MQELVRVCASAPRACRLARPRQCPRPRPRCHCSPGWKGTNITSRDMASGRGYEDAIAALNSLQSNAAYIKGVTENTLPKQSERFQMSQQYAEMVGLSPGELSKLSVVHVAGTKGKGSTSAYCESILRHNGFCTGFFSSPHLVSVTERIRINGIPLSTQKFSKFFWQVYDTLQEKKGEKMNMPPYFVFLTLMAFRVFIEENIDVAVVEVGIGGQWDTTNVLQDVSVVGITSLGIDHTSMLGNTLSSIAWQKAGILKPSATGFTVQGHPPEALQVIGERSVERKCPVEIAPSLNKYEWPDMESRQAALSLFWTNQLNASLALQITNAWMKRNELQKPTPSLTLQEAEPFPISRKTSTGLLNCRWPGRNQVLDSDCGTIKYFLDGAHTVESMQACVEWYRKSRPIGPSTQHALLLNMTGDRDRLNIIEPLLSCAFDKVIFSPNIVQSCLSHEDLMNARVTLNSQMKQTQALHDLWTSMTSQNTETTGPNISNTCLTSCVNDALEKVPDGNNEWTVLVTGSLHLVGAVLSILDPNLDRSERF